MMVSVSLKAQQSAVTRKAILTSGLKLFAKYGFSTTSIDDIARAAGITKGAVYWSFRDKRDLFLALVERELDRPARELMAITEKAPADAATAPLVSSGLATLVRERGELVVLLAEQWALAVRDPGLRDAYLRREAMLRETLARALQARHETTGVPLTYPPEQLATAILALGHGLAMSALVDPAAVPDELLGEVLQLIYEGLEARARRERPGG